VSDHDRTLLPGGDTAHLAEYSLSSSPRQRQLATWTLKIFLVFVVAVVLPLAIAVYLDSKAAYDAQQRAYVEFTAPGNYRTERLKPGFYQLFIKTNTCNVRRPTRSESMEVFADLNCRLFRLPSWDPVNRGLRDAEQLMCRPGMLHRYNMRIPAYGTYLISCDTNHNHTLALSHVKKVPHEPALLALLRALIGGAGIGALYLAYYIARNYRNIGRDTPCSSER